MIRSISMPVLTLGGLSLSCRAASRAPRNETAAATEIWRALSIVERPLPSLSIPGVNGGSINVEFPFGGPTVLVLFNERDCFTCANIQADS